MARWSARHRWRVVIAWVLLVVVVTFASGLVDPKTDPDMGAPGDSGALIDLLEERFEEADPEETGSEEVVVFSHPSLTVNDKGYRDSVQALLDELQALRLVESGVIGSTTVISRVRIVGETTSHYDIGASRENSPFVAQNETGGDVTFTLVDLEMDSEKAIDMVVETVEGFQAPEGFEVLIGGPGTQALQIDQLVQEDFDRAFGLNLPITFIILIIAFGAAVAAAIPIVLAMFAIFIAYGSLALVTQVYPLLDGYTEIVLLIGLATGIDYSLFIITRFRAERRAGRSKEEALMAASGTSGKAVFFAGVTVVFALTGMFLIGNTIFNGIAISAITVVALAIVISMTLLPALLSLLGDKINRLRLPFLGRTGEGSPLASSRWHIRYSVSTWATTAPAASTTMSRPRPPW
jgi:RND superfamily putative drug exporter